MSDQFKIHIYYDFRDGPWGGGNQFLKAMRRALAATDNYANNLADADAVLINSHHFGEGDKGLEILRDFKKRSPHIPIIHRIDGPVKLIRGAGGFTDYCIFKANSLYADATIFQTQWSREETLKLGYKPKEPLTTIINAVDDKLFYPAKNHTQGKKLKLIASGWAANKRKGFDIYHYLDEHLDFDRFEMRYVGNIIRPFKNIVHIPPKGSAELAEILRGSDAYITASRNDPCSNALCEGLACGLPAAVLDSGGHGEIAGNGGVRFKGRNDVIEALEELAENYDLYRSAINRPSIEEVAAQYLDFTKLCTRDCAHNPRRVPQNAPKTMRAHMACARTFERIKSGVMRRLGDSA